MMADVGSRQLCTAEQGCSCVRLALQHALIDAVSQRLQLSKDAVSMLVLQG